MMTYDAPGNLATKQNARGQVATMTYDGVNRQTGELFPAARRTTFTYDATGNRPSAADHTGTPELQQTVRKIERKLRKSQIKL